MLPLGGVAGWVPREAGAEMELGAPRVYWEEHPAREKGRSETGQGEPAGGNAALKSLWEPRAKGAIGEGLAFPGKRGNVQPECHSLAQLLAGWAVERGCGGAVDCGGWRGRRGSEQLRHVSATEDMECGEEEMTEKLLLFLALDFVLETVSLCVSYKQRD